MPNPHQDNLDFITQCLQNKPITADLFRKILEFNASSPIEVKVIFPERKVPNREFLLEWYKYFRTLQESNSDDISALDDQQHIILSIKDKYY